VIVPVHAPEHFGADAGAFDEAFRVCAAISKSEPNIAANIRREVSLFIKNVPEAKKYVEGRKPPHTVRRGTSIKSIKLIKKI